MEPEEAARRREQAQATQAAHRARRAVLAARIAARMAVEGYVPIRADAFDPRTHGAGVLWTWTAWEGGRTGYRRISVVRTARPSWSHYLSIYGARGIEFATALPDATIYVRPQ